MRLQPERGLCQSVAANPVISGERDYQENADKRGLKASRGFVVFMLLLSDRGGSLLGL